MWLRACGPLIWRCAPLPSERSSPIAVDLTRPRRSGSSFCRGRKKNGRWRRGHRASKTCCPPPKRDGQFEQRSRRKQLRVRHQLLACSPLHLFFPDGAWNFCAVRECGLHKTILNGSWSGIVPRALSIYLPRWPTWLAQRESRRANNVQRETAWLLWTSDRGTQQVVHCCRRAAEAGVRAGMTLAHARSLLGGLQIKERPDQPDKSLAALRRLARWMLRLAPSVAVDEPDGLMLDIDGCERLFSSEAAHVRKIDAALRKFGLTPRITAAPTYACAWALARYGRQVITSVTDEQIEAAIAPLSVAALRIDSNTIDALADVGVERIEHVLALPRDELAARFGPEILRRLVLATGTASEAIEPIDLPHVFEMAHVFDGPVKRVEAIEITARELLHELLADLRQHDLGILMLEVELQRVDVGPVRLSITLTHPNRDHAHLWTLLSPKLERAHLGFGVEEITLRAKRTGRWSAEQSAFLREDARGHEPAALGELLDRLIDRLGPQAVTQVQIRETY